MSFYYTHYIYFGGDSLSNPKYSVSSLNYRSGPASDLDIQDDETAGGVTVLDSRESAKIITIGGAITYTADGDGILELSRELKRRLKKQGKTLRLIPKERCISLYPSNTLANITLAEDADTVVVTSEVSINDGELLKITVDPTLDTLDCALFIKTFPSLDLTGFDGLDVPFSINDSKEVYEIEMHLANSPTPGSNYQKYTAIKQAVGDPIGNFGNVMSYQLSGGSWQGSTGSLDLSDIQYFALRFKYTPNKSPFTVYLDEPYAFIDEYTENYTNSYLQGAIDIEYEESLQDITSEWSASILCEHEYSESTFYTLDVDDSFTTVSPEIVMSKTYSFDTGAKHPPKPKIFFTGGLSDRPLTLILNNQITKSTISITLGVLLYKTLLIDFLNANAVRDSKQVEPVGDFDSFFVAGKNTIEVVTSNKPNDLSLSVADVAGETSYYNQDFIPSAVDDGLYMAQQVFMPFKNGDNVVTSFEFYGQPNDTFQSKASEVRPYFWIVEDDGSDQPKSLDLALYSGIMDVEALDENEYRYYKDGVYNLGSEVSTFKKIWFVMQRLGEQSPGPRPKYLTSLTPDIGYGSTAPALTSTDGSTWTQMVGGASPTIIYSFRIQGVNGSTSYSIQIYNKKYNL